jgi:hypothetical protein
LSSSDFVYSINYHDEDQRTYETITIPESTNFLDVFDYIQNHYGIYSKGFGVFLSRQNWQLFRPYNVGRFAEGGKRLVVYNVHSDDMQALDRNYYVEGDITYLAATGESLVISEMDTVSLNEGTGVRFADVRSLEYKMNGAANGKEEIDPAKYLTEVNTNNRANGTFAPVLNQRFTDNPKAVSSDLMKRRGVSVTVKWENGLYHLLEPGMGVEFYYPQLDGVKKMRGCLVGVMEHSTILSNGFVEKAHGNVLALTFLLFPYG